MSLVMFKLLFDEAKVLKLFQCTKYFMLKGIKREKVFISFSQNNINKLKIN